VRFLTWVEWWMRTVCLWSESGILRCNYHRDRIIKCECDEREHNCCHKKCLRGCMASANAENSDPQNSNADCGEANNAGEEKNENQDQENDIVDWEDFGGLDQDPVDGLEDVDVCKYIAAMLLAYGVHCLVDTCDEHAGEDDQRNDDEENSANQLDGPEYCFKLDPSFHE